MTDREKLIELIVTIPVPCMVVAGVRGGKSLISASVIADHLLDNGVTFATDTNIGGKWISVEDDKPTEFVSVLGHMTDAGDFPAVRECYRITTDEFYFPALMEFHPIDKWAYMPEPKEDKHE